MSTRYWLFKSDPEVFSWADLLAGPDQATYWVGGFMVRATMWPVVWLFLLAGLWLCFPENQAEAGQVRQPVWAGKFYPQDPDKLKAMIADLTAKARTTEINLPADRPLKALIMPHAGLIYSGFTAAHAVHALENRSFEKVLLLGPDHRIGFSHGAVTSASAYATPLGLVHVHETARGLKTSSPLFRSIPEADQQEHSLEVVLPFLQTYLPAFEIVPIIFGPTRISQCARALEPLLGPNDLVVVSTDLSHYLDQEQACKRDQETIRMILNKEPEKLARGSNRACGLTPLRILLTLARERHWESVLVHASTSGDTAGPKDSVVGYATIALYGEKIMPHTSSSQLNPDQGQTLVELARLAIAQELGLDSDSASSSDIQARLEDPVFDQQRGTFVTLHIQDQLRGCIGSLVETEPLRTSIRTNAVNAAFRDPRFPPLGRNEFPEITIEVSILTEPQPLEYADPQDLVNKLRPNIDGVILSKGPARSTFLPQVWEQLSKPEDFLTHLCLKAGLPKDAWKKEHLEIQTYQVQYFEEQS